MLGQELIIACIVQRAFCSCCNAGSGYHFFLTRCCVSCHGYLFFCFVFCFFGSLVIVVACYRAMQCVTVTKGVNCT